MAKQLNVNLAFTADTSAAKAQLKDLQNQLSQLASTNRQSQQELGFTKQLHDATAAAAQLKVQLEQATNANTGKLDLSKFNQSLKQGGKSLQDYQRLLTSLGPAGDKAFASLADSILNADAPLKRVNSRLNELKTTLANTARWQLSSSILHGFMGAVSSAYGYAQDLNESLNNIRIVTGYNIDQMSRFADEANKAARALSTTTTEYTNASLIYYQQGLPEEEIAKRTDVTIKMANAAGVSAETVSDQMTAIWNNFYDGSKSLEYYADVLTALGAATASSTDEISDGVEKFAAVADTIGLSYEYAASALATVTAETRQSADVVGTAFRTIFARIQGLNLGETLDDGTTLNKYSQALEKVGISIFESNGQLKQMDDILDEMGSKWGTLNQQQQVALAQTVAGVRQYNQLIALMDKWNVFQSNVGIAEGSTGELQKQADIYAESWKAASKEVRAALEGIWQDIIDDEFIIDILNGFEKVIVTIDNVIQTMGGLKGVAALVGNILLNVFGKELANGINNIGYNIKVITGQAQREAETLKQQVVGLTTTMKGSQDSMAGTAQSNVYQGRAEAQEAYLRGAQRLSETEKLTVQTMMDGLRVLGEQVIKQGELADKAEEELAIQDRRAKAVVRTTEGRKELDDFKNRAKSLGQLQAQAQILTKTVETSIDSLGKGVAKNSSIMGDSFKKTVSDMAQDLSKLSGLNIIDENVIQELLEIDKKVQNITVNADGMFEGSEADLEELRTALKNFLQDYDNALLRNQDKLLDNPIFANITPQQLQTLVNLGVIAEEDGRLLMQAKAGATGFSDSVKAIQKTIDNARGSIISFGERVQIVAQSLTSLAMIANNVKGIVSTFNDDDLSGWEKFISIAGSMGMTLSSLIPIFKMNIENAKKTAVANAATATSNIVVGETAEVAAGGISKATAALKAFSTANVVILALTVAITAISAAVAIHKKRIEDQTKALEENLEKSKEKVETTQQEIDANNELINSMATLLKEYKENVDVKDQLDNVTWELARKYGVEGAAIAELRGDYESYNKVLEEVIKKQKEVQGEQVNQFQQSTKDASKIFQNAFEQKTFTYSSTGSYYKTISNKDIELNQALLEEGIRTAKLSNYENYVFFGNTEEELLSSYEALANIVEEREKEIAAGTAKSTEPYKQLKEIYDALTPSIEGYYNQLNGLSEAQASFTSFDINSYEDFETWLNNSRDSLSEVYKTEDEVNQAINNIIDGSFDLAIQEYEKWYRVVQDIKNINSDVAAILDIDALVDEYGLAAVAAVDWSKVTANTYEQAIDAAQKYQKAITDVAEAEQLKAGIQTAQNLIAKDGITSDNMADLQEAIAWGEGEVIAFSEFLRMTAIEQNQYLQSLLLDSAQTTTEGIIAQLDYTKAQIEQYKYTQDERAKEYYAQAKERQGYYQDILNAIENRDYQALENFGYNHISLSRLKQEIEEKLSQINPVIEQFDIDESAYNEAQETVETLTEDSYIQIHLDNTKIREDIQNLLDTEFSIGDSLTFEQVNLLEDLGVENLENYLQEMSDGTYKLVNAAEEFNLAVNGGLSNLNTAGQNAIGTLTVGGEHFSASTGAFLNTEAASGSQLAGAHYQYFQDTGIDTSGFMREAADGTIEITDLEAYTSQLAESAKTYELFRTNSLAAAESVDELNQMLAKGEISQEEYNANFERVQDVEIEKLAEKYELVSDEIESQAERLADAFEEQGDSSKDAARKAIDLATANQRMNRGIENLYKNLKDYIKILQNSNKASVEYSKTMDDMKDILADVFNVADSDLLSDNFIEGLIEDGEQLEKIANGDIDAINSLRMAVANDIVASITAEIDDTAIYTEVNSLWAWLQENTPDLTVQSTISGSSDFATKLNDMIVAAKMTKDQVNSLLGAMGMSAELHTKYEETEMQVPTYVEHWESTVKDEGETGENGEIIRPPSFTRKKYTVPGEPYTVKGYAEVVSLKTVAADGTESGGDIDIIGSGSPSFSNTPTGRASLGGGGGGSSSPASKTKTTKRSDVVDRYKEVNDSLDDLTDALSDANKESDRLYGQARIDNLKKQNSLLQEEIGLIKDKIASAKQYLATDKAGVGAAASAAGVNFTYDEAGNITNYTAEMNRLYDELKAAQDSWNASYANATQEEQQDYEENVIKPIEEKIEALKEAVSAYEETREMIEDLENDLDDAFYEWQDNNYEILHYAMEIQIEINDLEMKKIDYYLNKISDDFYQMAEAAQLMLDQIPITFDSLGHYENFYNEITAAYAAGEISQADYVEGMKESYNAILDNLSALNDLDKEMLHYYENTLAAAADEMSHYTEQLEHLTSVLDHYRNIVELINGEFDYDAIGTILEGQAITRKNELDTATEYYKMLQSQKADIERSLAAASNEAAREGYRNELKAIKEALVEAHEDMLSKTEAWAETMKAVYENTAAEAAHRMEMAFTNGMGFDALNGSLERLSAIQDVYLTKTNQIYETQTLINTVQQAIDKTTNQAAKIRLDNYAKEIEALQQKNKLSHLELEIAKAQYEVLLAEIALEEAQNAKATVRLQRDNEGNFGYVYTADQEQISSAEQNLLDAQNALYNIGLEATNDYGQRLLELQQQLSEDLIALEEERAAGRFATEEEFNIARDQLIQEYNELFMAYSEQYTTALGVDTAIQEEAWVNAYDSMINKTQNWGDTVKEYTELCEDAYQDWRQAVEAESSIVDAVLNDIEQEIKDVTNASNELARTVQGEVIPAIDSELDRVRATTSAYFEQRQEILALIAEYERLADAILAAIQAQAMMSSMNAGGGAGGGGFDPSKDYSALMGNSAYGSGQYYTDMGYRDQKIEMGYYDVGEATTARVDAYYAGLAAGTITGLPNGKKFFTDLTRQEWINLVGFATGGYTGAWGPDGRVAMLHEKELVLNPEDTVNFLSAVGIVRDIVKAIDVQALNNQQFMSSFTPGFNNLGFNDTLEQIVQIEANFPSVTDRSEIEEAFNNLINTASQFANRKKL